MKQNEKIRTKTQKEQESNYPKTLLKVFVNKKKLLKDGVSKDTVRATLITGQGERWLNPDQASRHKIVTE